MNDHKHRLALAIVELLTEIFRFANALIVLLGMISNYFVPKCPRNGLQNLS